jgi:hypothetical protein
VLSKPPAGQKPRIARIDALLAELDRSELAIREEEAT